MCADVAALRREGKNVILVSSGAIALGRRALKLRSGPLKLEESQAAAAAGQVRLAEAYADILAGADIVAAQILLTLGRHRRAPPLSQCARDVEDACSSSAQSPVINENDTVATAEIRLATMTGWPRASPA